MAVRVRGAEPTVEMARASDAGPPAGMVPTGTADRRAAGVPPREARFGVHRSRFLLWLVLGAFALRAVAAVGLHGALIARGGDGFLGPDDRGYDDLAWQQALEWRGDGPGVPPADSYMLNAYTDVGAAVYIVLGRQPLALKLLNCLLGALTAGLVYLTARRLFGPRAAALAGVAAALFPSTFLWSLTMLKDTIFVFAAALVLWLLTELLVGGRWRLVLPVLAAVALVGELRIYVQVLFAGLVPAAVLLQSRARLPRKWPLAAVLAVGCAALVWFSGGAQLLGIVAPERLNQQRTYAATNANSAFAPGLPTPSGAAAPAEERALVGESVRELVAWLPTGLAYTLAAPFPWAADRAAERAALPDVAAWYAAVALALLAVVRHRRAWRRWAHLAGFVGGILLLLALTEGNLGTLLRHRGMVVPLVLVFSGEGAAWLWARSRARRLGLAAVPLDARTARPRPGA